MSVAEAMLAGCVPVVTAAGALPEVVDAAGVLIDSAAPRKSRRGCERALAWTTRPGGERGSGWSSTSRWRRRGEALRRVVRRDARRGAG